MTVRAFPIHPSSRRRLPLLPPTIPWAALEEYEGAAQRNHDQSLARLAERGGLTWQELRDIISGSKWDGKMYGKDGDPELVARDAADALWVLRYVERMQAANGESPTTKER